MKKIILSAFTICLFAQCQKEKNLQEPSNNKEIDGNSITQKLYDLNYDQTNIIVTSFKMQANNNPVNKNVMHLDSSMWILEAALNSDFDADKGTNEVYDDSLIMFVPINNDNTINQSDINKTYLNLKQLIDQKLSANKKIQLIDVTAKIVQNTIKYKLEIVLFNSSELQKPSFTFACDPFYTDTASPSKLSPVFPNIYNHFLACPNSPALDGPTIIKAKLNGCGITLCAFGYYTNIVTTTFSGYSHPTALYIRNGLTASDFCLPVNAVISTAKLNQYRTNIKNLADANIPVSPANMRITNYDIIYKEDFTLCGCGSNQTFVPLWDLKVKYAVLNCPL